MRVSMRPGIWLSALVILALCGRGRATPPVRPVKPLTEEVTRGIVFVVEGIGGFGAINVTAAHALPKGGVPHEVRSFVWTHGRGKMFKDLQDHRYVERKAHLLAEEILSYKKDFPDRPVYMMAKSGGCGIALAAAEQLPPNTLERIVLLSAAVATDYDLRPALRATHKEIVSFYSPHDSFILGWGTSQFGTIDRVYGPSAGLRGFTEPLDLSDNDRLQLYGRLVQVSWRPDMIFEGHLGAHLGTSMPAFVRKEVAPWFK
jgi:hypothetical protein